MPRIKAIAESAPTSNPIRRVSKVNPRHPASKLYTSPDGGSVRLTWSPVNQTWFLLWPGDAPVERQQVLGQFQQWEEGDREARRIVERSGAPAENPVHGDPPGTSLHGFHVILRGGRPSVRVMASSKWDAEQQVRLWGQPDLYPIWYILSDEEVAQQNIGQNIVENPRAQQKTIVLAWTEDGTEAYGPEARVDLGHRRASRPVKVAFAALWRASGDRTDIAKAQAYADKSNASAESVKYYVFTYPTTDRDWKEHAKRDVLKAAG